MFLPARSEMMMMKPLFRLYVVECDAQAKQKKYVFQRLQQQQRSGVLDTTPSVDAADGGA
jgi:hypothetical protein